MRTFAVNVPTKPYLRKYLHKRYGYPVVINNRTLIGSVLVAFLKKKVYSDRSSATDLQNTFAALNDRLECVVSRDEVFYGNCGIHIEPEKVILINRYFAAQFEEDVHRFCQQHLTNSGRHPGYDRALEKFADMYDIEFDVDITFEALKKMEYRYRKKLEENHTAIVPSSKHLQQSLF